MISSYYVLYSIIFLKEPLGHLQTLCLSIGLTFTLFIYGVIRFLCNTKMRNFDSPIQHAITTSPTLVIISHRFYSHALHTLNTSPSLSKKRNSTHEVTKRMWLSKKNPYLTKIKDWHQKQNINMTSFQCFRYQFYLLFC